jgi:hypothetical protein
VEISTFSDGETKLGLQIRIAQSRNDEDVINRYILSKFRVCCLPRLFPDSKPRPMELSSCDSNEQVLFIDTFSRLVCSHVSPVLDKPKLFHVSPKRGLCLEWERTEERDEKYIPGRYYLDTSNPISNDSFQLLKKLMSAITSHVKRTYPMKSDPPTNIYVGSDLSSKLAAGVASVVYRDGSPITLPRSGRSSAE